uniref:Uncharacterized protein n=1 Tax=Rhizophora mucronata TaxID=61149 RepID=A0A2P2IID3_RHIMU
MNNKYLSIMAYKNKKKNLYRASSSKHFRSFHLQ